MSIQQNTRTRAARQRGERGRTGVRIAVLALVGLAGSGSGVAAQEAVTFGEAWARVREAHERVLSAEAGLRRAEAERGVARSRFLPEVTVAGRHTRLDEPLVMDLSPIRGALVALHPEVPAGAIPPFRSKIQEGTFQELDVEARLPLFTGGRLVAGARAAGAAVRGARAARAGVVDALAVELVERYFGLRLAEEAVAVRKATARSLRRHVDRAERLEASGQIAHAERLRAEVARAEADRALLAAERQLSVARLALANTLMLEGAVAPTTPLFRPVEVEPLDSLKARAVRGNAGLRQLEAGRARAREATRAAEGAFAPTIGLFATRALRTEYLTILDPEWAVGLSVRLPVFTGGRRWYELEAAQAREREVSLRARRARRDVELLVAQRHLELEEAEDRLVELESARSLAEESLRSQEVAFSAGLATSLDVVDAEAALSRVRLGMLKALYDWDVALARVLEAVGETERLPEYMRLAGTDEEPVR